MRLIKFLTASLFMAAIFTSCSKDKDNTTEPNTVAITGLWEGKLGSGVSIPNGFFGLQIKENGKLERVAADKSVSGTGTWTLDGNSFKGEYTATNGVTVKVSATFDKFLGKLTGGKWENSGDNGGTWYANRKEN